MGDGEHEKALPHATVGTHRDFQLGASTKLFQEPVPNYYPIIQSSFETCQELSICSVPMACTSTLLTIKERRNGGVGG
jgi:hypothetical protein